MKTLDCLFIQTLFAIIKWPVSTLHHRSSIAFPFLAYKWQELIELQWNVYLNDARACVMSDSLQMHLFHTDSDIRQCFRRH